MLAELEHKVENRLVDDVEMYEEEKKRIEARAEELRSIEVKRAHRFTLSP